MRRTILCLIMWFLCQSNLNAQLLLSKEDSQDKISIDSYLEVGMYSVDNCCNFEKMLGRLRRVETDSIYLTLKSFQQTITYDEMILNNIPTKHQMSPTGGIAKNSIYYLNVLPDKDYLKRNETRQGIGALLVVTGLMTGLHSLLTSNQSKDRMLIAAGAELTTGVLLLTLFKKKKKKYSFEEQNNSWKIN